MESLTDSDVVSFEEIHTLPINRIRLSDDRVFSIGQDGNLIVWNKDNSSHIKTLNVSETQLVSLILSEEHVFVGGAYDDTNIWKWNKLTLNPLMKLTTDAGSILDLAIESKSIVSGSSYGLVVLRDETCLDEIKSVQTDQHIVLSVAIDRTHIYAGGIGNNTSVFDHSLNFVTNLEGHEANIFSLALDDRHVYSGSGEIWWGGPGSPRPSKFESAIRVWDKSSWECIAVLDGPTDNINSIHVDATTIYSVSDDGMLHVYDKSDRQLLLAIDTGSRCLNALAVDEEHIFIGGNDRCIWKISKTLLDV